MNMVIRGLKKGSLQAAKQLGTASVVVTSLYEDLRQGWSELLGGQSNNQPGGQGQKQNNPGPVPPTQ